MHTKEEREGILWEFHRSDLSAPAACRSLPLFPNKDNLYAWLKLEEAGELTAREMPDRAERMHCSHGEGRLDDVGVREGQHEEAQAGADAGNAEIGLAEVGLGPAGLPHQVEEPLALEAVPPPQLGDVAADGGLADVGAVLVDQPAPYAPGGVSLLAPVQASSSSYWRMTGLYGSSLLGALLVAGGLGEKSSWARYL